MTYVQFASLVRYYTKTNTTTFPDADIILLANTEIDVFGNKLKEVGGNYLYQEFLGDLALNQRQYSYSLTAFPGDFSVECKFNGTDWIRLLKLELDQWKERIDETTILNYFSNAQGRAYYGVGGSCIFIFSGAIALVVNGLRIFSSLKPQKITNLALANEMSLPVSATTKALPVALEELLARSVSIIFKSTKEKPIPLSEREQKFEFDFQTALQSLDISNQDFNRTMPLPPASDRGNEGEDY